MVTNTRIHFIDDHAKIVIEWNGKQIRRKCELIFDIELLHIIFKCTHRRKPKQLH